MFNILLTILVGSCAGFIGGSTGLGGTFILLPGLLMLNIISDYKLAVGTILLAMLPPISILATQNYYKRDKIDYTIAFFICISYIIAAKYGAIVNKLYTEPQLKYFTAFILFSFSLFFFITANKKYN
jgi:uncharacterized protein